MLKKTIIALGIMLGTCSTLLAITGSSVSFRISLTIPQGMLSTQGAAGIRDDQTASVQQAPYAEFVPDVITTDIVLINGEPMILKTFVKK